MVQRKNQIIQYSVIAISLVICCCLFFFLTDYAEFRGDNKFAFRQQQQRKLQAFDPKTVVMKNSATGETFSGDPFRTSDHLERKFHTFNAAAPSARPPAECSTRWSVVTTINAPSEAVLRAANMKGWCMVIVADTKTPVDYLQNMGLLTDDQSVHFLSVDLQKEMILTVGQQYSEFIKAIPYEHFSRKNLGYLYAIKRGAEFIFDFDDDNIVDLVEDVMTKTSAPINILPNEISLQGAGFVLMTKDVFNPYPLMGPTIPNSWPRGFPIHNSVDENYHGSILFGSKKYSMEQIGVLQFVANENPDIDAIHRMTKPLPMYFKGRNQGGSPIVTPLHSFVPYNAQATIHTPNSLWATLLPSTVPGRVSDIWRGYFSEAIFQEYGLQVAFLPPDITQKRNPHDLMADMDAERDLYHKTSALIDFLTNWIPQTETIPGRMEELWIALYERGYIEEEDVRLVQLWLSALVEAGYDFNRMRRHDRQHHVVLMGQYNYDHDINKLKFWTQKWREIFDVVEVRGPFPDDKLQTLRAAGVNAHKGGEDNGYFSPVMNFWSSLLTYSENPRIEGVIYLHDDAMLDMGQLTQGHYQIPTNRIMLSGNPINDPTLPSYYTLYKNETSAQHDLYEYIFKGMTDAEYKVFDNPETKYHYTTDALLKALNERASWLWVRCVPQQFAVLHDPRSAPYLDADGGLGCPYFHQSDFMFIPTRLARQFTEIAQLLMEKSVFLECAIPQIAKMMLEHVDGTEVRTINLCTTWNGTKRGKSLMISDCMREEELPSMYHPLKVNLLGERVWDDVFDFVTHRNGRFQNIDQVETF